MSEAAADLAAVRAALARLPGLDPAINAAFVRGDTGRYLGFLLQFLADGERVVGESRAALAAGDATLAGRGLHALRGMAGLVGAVEVEYRARELEGRLRAGLGVDGTAVGLVEVALHLANLAEAVRPLAPAAPAGGRPGPVEDPEAALAAFAALLATGDVRALALARDLGGVLEARLGA
ncbi:MAG: Hpt domain-containing protein, partial [Proteobacteria bacterium]|nr:Hpt domain-containing protein [Pseudomonadota bacterium]